MKNVLWFLVLWSVGVWGQVCPGLIAHYPLDGNAQDYGPYIHDATVIGAVPSSLGIVGTSLWFDGVDDCVDLGDPPHLRIVGDFTVSAWVKIANDSSWHGIVSKNVWKGVATGMYGWMLYRGMNGGCCLNRQYRFTNAFGLVPYYTQGDVPHPDNEWRFVCAVREGNLSKVYVDGILTASRVLGVPIGDSGDKAYIGRQYAKHTGGFYGFLRGNIDEVKIWNYALTSEEIAGEYVGGG